MEIRLIRLELQEKKEDLLNADSALADKRLSDFLNFINKNPVLNKLATKLPTPNMDWDKWKAGLWNALDYQLPEDEIETAGMCYEILKRYRGNDLIQIAVNFHVNSRSVTDHIQKYLETFVPFVFQYFDKKLLEAETLISPVDVVREIEEIVDEKTIEKYPDTNKRLREAYKKLFNAETNDDYKGIANICRGILIDFANEVFKDSYIPEKVEALKGDDAKDKLKYTYRYFSKKKNASYVKGRENTIIGCWQMVSACVHRKDIKEYEIKECVLFTYLIIKAIIDVQSD